MEDKQILRYGAAKILCDKLEDAVRTFESRSKYSTHGGSDLDLIESMAKQVIDAVADFRRTR